MIILGVDPSATQTGLAFYDIAGKTRDIVTASFSAEGKTAEAQADDFGRKFAEALVVHQPQLVCHETAIRHIAIYAKKDLTGAGFYTPNADQMILPEIQGHLRQACFDRGIALDQVAAKTWRAQLYGRGGGNMNTAQAKATARQYCERLEIAFGNHNEAEAACIAVWASRCSDVLRWLQVGAGNNGGQGQRGRMA